MKRILVIEPYYGGSHKRFLDGLTASINGNFTLLTLPARKWKMRMQLSAPWFIEQIRAMDEEKRAFDVVLFSTFIDVAVFKALSMSLQGWNPQCRYHTYFHENQFNYPGFLDKHTNQQFTSINFTTALTSDSIAFNSEFNRNGFLDQCRKYLGKAADMDLDSSIGQIENKSLVLHPGIDFRGIDRTNAENSENRVKRIVWNHRWEHDKNPEEFFDVMFKLADAGIDFELYILGQKFIKNPVCFETAQQKLKSRILRFGFLESVDEYYQCLVDAHIVVSTAIHEFFGISVLEAVRAGCLPVLPNRLAYPELFDDRYLYENGGLFERLRYLLQHDEHLDEKERIRLTEPYDWRTMAASYSSWFNM